MVKPFRNDETQDAISEKFEPLVRSRTVSTRMHERTHQQGGVAEFVTEPILKPGETCGVSQFR